MATVLLSSAFRDLQAALVAAKAAPDIRQDKVADARRRLESGTYVIDLTRIAAGLLASRT